MGEAIGEVLPLALGVAISPVPIIAVILMLFAPRAGGVSAGFLVGWLAGIVLAVVAALLLAGLIPDDSGSGPPAAVSWIKILLGAVFLLLAVLQWRRRPAPGEALELPRWMQGIDQITVNQAAGLGFVLAAINPKNLALALAAGVAIGGSGLPGGEQTIVVIVYVLIAASTVLAPVVGYAAAAERMRGPLDELKGWLETNNSTVMAVLLLVMGFVVLGKGLGGLL